MQGKSLPVIIFCINAHQKYPLYRTVLKQLVLKLHM